MTSEQPRHALRQVRTLLLDFDGPVCSIFAGYPARTVADELRGLIADQGVQLPATLLREADPLQVLRSAEALGDDALAQLIVHALRDREITAADSAQPTHGLEGVLTAASHTGRRLGIVSNNSTAAVEKYLGRQGLLSMFEHIIGRYDGMKPHLLKPDPHLVILATTTMDAESRTALLVGDAVSDIQAARAAGIRTIGYANKPGKDTALTEAGADAIVGTLDELARALRETPLSAQRAEEHDAPSDI